MSVTCHGNVDNAKKIIKSISKKRFTFGLVTSYSETCEIPGITIAGADQEFLKFTAPADSEYIEYGKFLEFLYLLMENLLLHYLHAYH